MTNAEKFEEVFGIKVDECPSGICHIADDSYCQNASGCDKCELYNFWEQKYIGAINIEGRPKNDN